jgi:hypothetical protein
MAVQQNELEGLVNKALEISERRAETLGKLKAALLSGEDSKALELAREYCGIDHAQSNRVN